MESVMFVTIVLPTRIRHRKIQIRTVPVTRVILMTTTMEYRTEAIIVQLYLTLTRATWMETIMVRRKKCY